MTFVIDAENNITAYAGATAPDGAELKLSEHRFSSEKELATLAGSWPGGRLIEIWNGLPGVIPVKKFTDRKTAVARMWKAIQNLVPTPEASLVKAPKVAKAGNGTQAASSAKVTKEKPVKTTKAKSADQPVTARDGSKKARVLELLRHPNGATLAELMAATEWQAHSVRGFISGTVGKKMGLKVESAKRDQDRVYSIST